MELIVCEFCCSDAGVPTTPAAEPAPIPTDLTGSLHAALVSECDTIFTQFSHVSAVQAALLRRAELQAQLEAAEEAGDDFVLVGTLGEQLETLKVETAQALLTEEDYLTLAARHASVVQRMTERCKELAKAKAYAEVKVLGAKLQDLKALDVTGLPSFAGQEPVLPAPPAPATAAEEEDDRANGAVHVPVSPGASQGTLPAVNPAYSDNADAEEDDGANDPVWVPPTPEPCFALETEGCANDPVYVPPVCISTPGTAMEVSIACTAICITAENEEDGANDPVYVAPADGRALDGTIAVSRAPKMLSVTMGEGEEANDPVYITPSTYALTLD
jgi:hypothetical protein